MDFSIYSQNSHEHVSAYNPAIFRVLLLYRSTKIRKVAQCLRSYATNRKEAGSIPDGVVGIFIDI